MVLYDFFQMRNSITLDDGSQPMHVVTAFTGEPATLIDLNLAPLGATPVVELPLVETSNSSNKKTEENHVGSVFVNVVPFTSDTMMNPFILTAGLSQVGQEVTEGKHAGSILIDGQSTLFEMRPTTPVEEEQQPASILIQIEETCDAETPAPAELVPNECKEESDPANAEYAVRYLEQLAAPILINVDEPFDPVAAAAAAFPMLKASNPFGGSSPTQDRRYVTIFKYM